MLMDWIPVYTQTSIEYSLSHLRLEHLPVVFHVNIWMCEELASFALLGAEYIGLEQMEIVYSKYRFFFFLHSCHVKIVGTLWTANAVPVYSLIIDMDLLCTFWSFLIIASWPSWILSLLTNFSVTPLLLTYCVKYPFDLSVTLQ